MRGIAFTTAAALTVLLGANPLASAAEKTIAVSSNADRSPVWMKSRAKTWDTEHKTWVDRGGYTYYRVPEDKYSTSFGPEHTFRIDALPYRMVSGESRYQYNGYWMTVVDPWPETWTNGWWTSDDVYVRYDNGYYLYNNKYPDTGLALRMSQ